MYRKLFALSLFFVFTSVSGFAQDAPSSGVISRAMIVPGMGGSYLGVQTIDVTKENYSKFGLGEVRGVAVDKVLKDSPAEKAGLQNGDVIVRFDGETVSSVRKLTRLIGEVAPDHKAKVTVLRNGGERDIEVTIGKREINFNAGRVFSGDFPAIENLPVIPRMPSVPRAPAAPNAPNVPNVPLTPFPQVDGGAFVWRGAESRQIGVSISSLSKQLGDYFGVADGKGLLVRDVRTDSPAAKAGIKAGDVIVEIDGKKIEDSGDLIKAVNEKKEGAVSITVVRDKNRQTFTVEPEKAVEKVLFAPLNEDDN